MRVLLDIPQVSRAEAAPGPFDRRLGAHRRIVPQQARKRRDTILYEDLFPSSHEALRSLIEALGLGFRETILQGREPTSPAPSPVEEHSPYRYWQVSQPFRCMNGLIDLPQHLTDKIAGLPAFRELWGTPESSLGAHLGQTVK